MSKRALQNFFLIIFLGLGILPFQLLAAPIATDQPTNSSFLFSGKSRLAPAEPILTLNEGVTVTASMSGTISNLSLLVTDIDTPPSGITYTLVTTPFNGSLLLLGFPLEPEDIFLQSDIDSGNLVFQHNSNMGITDSFAFMADDNPIEYDLKMGNTTIASINSGGTQGSSSSSKPSISADGRFIAFESSANNLVAVDNNFASDIFVHDRVTGETIRVSVASGGGEANSGSNKPSISADGRYVAFYSIASNLVLSDTNSTFDIFVHDIQTGVTTRASVDSGGVEGNSFSFNARISGNGRYVTFYSDATNLVAGDTNAKWDVFVHDTQTATTTRVSVDSAELQTDGNSFEPAISEDGRYITFQSESTDLIASDTNGVTDIFVRDTILGITSRISIDSAEIQSIGHSYKPYISANGRYIAFQSDATNLIASDTNGVSDIFLRDTVSGTTTIVSVPDGGGQGNSNSIECTISANGRFIAFYSFATNLVPGDTNARTDIFVYDVKTSSIVRASVNDSGIQGNNFSFASTLSGNGRFVAFDSISTNLVAPDTNGQSDVFIRSGLPVPAVADSFSIVIQQLPTATDNSYNGTEDIPSSGNLILDESGMGIDDDGGDGGLLTVYTYTMPITGTVQLNVDGSFTYTPALNFNGIVTFMYQITDTVFLSNMATVTITVAPVNDLPVAIGDMYTTTMNTPLVISSPGFVVGGETFYIDPQFRPFLKAEPEELIMATDGVLANDFDFDNDPLTVNSFTAATANGIVSLATNGTFIYLPNTDFTGDDTFVYIISDNVLTDTAIVTITVSNPNNLPIAVSDIYTTAEDISLVVDTPGVIVNDSDSDGDTLSSFMVQNGMNGEVVLAADGRFSYIPNLNYFGPDSFTYYVSDGQADSITTTVWLNVTAVNDAPIAFADVYTTEQQTLLGVTAVAGLLINDSEPVENDPFIAVLATSPVTGTLVLTDDGSFDFTPPVDFSGVITFEYVANDGDNSDLTLVTINVTPCAIVTDAIDIDIAAAGVDATFSWAPFADSYEIYRNGTPYFAVGGVPYDVTAGSSYTETNIFGAPSEVWYYQVIGVNGCGTSSSSSNETAVFEFDIQPGS